MDAWKPNVEKEEESFLKILHTRMANSSAHGLPNIHNSSKPITKLFWLLLFLTGIGVITWQVVTLFQTYLAYNYTVSLEIKFNRSQSFPAITICNMNPVMKSKLEVSDDSFRELFDVNFQPPGAFMDMMDVVDPGLEAVDLFGGMVGGLSMGGGGDGEAGKDTGDGADAGATTQQPGAVTIVSGPGAQPLAQDESSGSATTPVSDTTTTTDTHTTEAGFNTTDTDNTTEAIETWEERQQGDFFHKKSDGYLKQQRLVVKLANKTMDERKSLGHSLEDMLLECSWRGFKCSPANFTKIYDPQYGNCYMFNSGKDEEILSTNRPGPNYGLSLELFVQQDEYMEDLTDVAGFRAVIHYPSKMPFPSDDGIFVSPGLVTAIGVRVLEVERLPEPYGECKDDVDNIEDNIYYQNYNISYSIQTCEQSCYQRAVIRDCGCSDPSFPVPLDHNDTFYPCDIDNDIETDCLNDLERKYNDGKLGCECQTACHDISYLPTISSAIWPSEGYEKKLFEKMIDANEEMRRQVMGANPSDWTRSNMAKLEIYFDEFNYEYIRQDPAYTIPDLLSDMGGQLGLWLGLSVITIFEIFEGIWIVISFFCTRHRNKTRPMHSIPTSRTGIQTPPPAYVAHLPEKK